MAENTSTVKFSRANINEGDIVIGALLLIASIIGLTFQTATTEAYGHTVQDLTLWQLFYNTIMQLPGIVTGSVHISELPRLMMGWGIEAIYYLSLTGHRKTKQATANHHPWAVIGFDALAVICVCYCGWTDWTYTSQLVPDFWSAVLVTSLISACVVFFGPIGWSKIKNGFGH